MGDELQGIEEDVPFDWGGAAALERALRRAASVLDDQIPRRNGYAERALDGWQGEYSRQFVTRMGTCTTDGNRLATAMEQAAGIVRELRDAAQREQDRREKARAWQRERDDRNLLEQGVDSIGSLFGGGDKPPVPPPEPPPQLLGPPRCVTPREG